MEIEVINFSRYNPRACIKRPVWFALSNRLLEDPDFFDFSDAEFKAWIYILSQASQKNSSIVIVNFAHAKRVCGIEEKIMIEVCSKLEKLKCIQVHDHDMITTCMITTRQYKTLHDTTEQVARNSPTRPDKILNGKIWDAYSIAYLARYGTEPVRNAKVNAQISQLAKRLGEEAPDVVRFYVGHSKSFYVQKAHEIGLCLADAEGLRTQWATGNKITNKLAQQTDAASALGDQLKRIREGKL